MKKLLTTLLIFVLNLNLIPISHAVTNPGTIASVVLLSVIDSAGENYVGSGVVVSSDINILTAAHVIIDESTNLPAEDIQICVINDEFDVPECRFTAKIIAYDQDLDLALLAPEFFIDDQGELFGEEITPAVAESFGAPFVDFADATPALGESVSIFGFPAAALSPTITLTQGSISSFIPLDENLIWYYTTDATINPGNSGGPVHNTDEKVVGIVTAVSTEGIGGNYGYVISTDVIALWFLELVEQGLLNFDFVVSIFSNDIIDTVETTDLTNVQIFTDVDIDTKNAEAIAYLKNNNIVSGYPDGSFKPLDNLNRAELMKILVEGAGYDPDPNIYNSCFPDVRSQWFAKYVCFAEEQNWIIGYPDGNFKPENFVNKAEAIKILLEVMEVDLINPVHNPFQDVPYDAWFAPYINTAQTFEILEESGVYYNPANYITRGQISENIYRLLLLGENIEKIAYINALVETTCLTNGFSDPDPDQATLDAITEIYANYGFPVEDDLAMAEIFQKYENNEEIDLAVGFGVYEQCPEAIDNLLNLQ